MQRNMMYCFPILFILPGCYKLVSEMSQFCNPLVGKIDDFFYLLTGNRTVNTVPRGSLWLERTLTIPPCKAMIRLTSARPRPLPSVLRALEPRYSSSNILD